MAFINVELESLGAGWGKLEDYCSVIDTLKLARELHPGQKNSLDALCGRYAIDNSQRDVHGALLDAQILLEVYLAMTGGQTALSLDEEAQFDNVNIKKTLEFDKNRHSLRIIEPSVDEIVAHKKFLDEIDYSVDGQCIWRKLEDDNSELD